MVDPNIILQSQTPMQLQGQALNLQQMQQNIAQGKQNMALTDQRIQSETLANQQAQRAQAAQSTLNQALAANTTKDPVTGAPIIDYDKVTAAMNDAGFGQEAMQFKNNVNALKDSDLRLSQLSDQVKNDQASHAAQLLGTVLDAPPAARAVVYQRALDQAQQMGYIKPGTMPAQYTPDLDPILAAKREQALSVVQQYGTKYNEARVDAANQRAQAAYEMQKAAEQRALNAEATRRYVDTKQVDKDGHPIALDTHTGQYVVSPNTQVDMTQAPAAQGRQLTPDASVANQRANQTDYEKSASAEQQSYQQAQALRSALDNGQTYIDKNGRSVLFSTMKDASGNSIKDNPQAIAALRNEMEQRLETTSKGLYQAVSNKNNAMQRNGVKPQVSTQDAIAGYANTLGLQAPSGATAAKTGTATSGQPAYTGKTFQTDPTGKSQYKVGQTVYYQGRPVKIAGYTADGKVITGN